MPGVMPRVMPAHSATSPVSVTPSSWMYRERNGITRVKPVKPTKVAATTAIWLRRQFGFRGFTGPQVLHDAPPEPQAEEHEDCPLALALIEVALTLISPDGVPAPLRVSRVAFDHDRRRGPCSWAT